MILAAVLTFCLQAPVPGELTAPFAPTGRYAGHWGLDLAAQPGSPVRAPAAGIVTFAGSVAGMQTVTIDHGQRMRSSVSYLESINVRAGDEVAAGALVGRSGPGHGEPQLHLSVRVDGNYVDPAPYLVCGGGEFGRLYLLPPPPGRSYARTRAKWTAGGNIRSAAHRPSPGRRGGLSSARAGSSDLHARRFPVAEGR